MASIVIVVFDGLQPAQVTPDLMPNLARLASEGVACQNHHAVFPTVTRANVASIVTGHHPGAHGLTANMLVIPEFDPSRAIGALEPVLTEVATRTPVLLKPALGDILHHHGLEYVAIGAGTTGNAYLQNPNAGISRRRHHPSPVHTATPITPGVDRTIRPVARPERSSRDQDDPHRRYLHRLRPRRAPARCLDAVVFRTRLLAARPRGRLA